MIEPPDDAQDAPGLRRCLRERVVAAGRNRQRRSALIAEVAATLVAAPLSNLERSQLLTGFTSALRPAPDEWRTLADRLSTAPAPVRNALAGCLPYDLLPILHRRSDVPDATQQAPREALGEPAQSPVPTPTIDAEKVSLSDDSAGTVLLLSTSDNQASNKSLLDRNNFGPVRVPTMAALQELLAATVDVVAVVVDGSFLLKLETKESQEGLFRTLALHSTFMWLRVDETNLQLSRFQVQEVLKDSWCERAPVSANQLAFGTGSTLIASDLDCIREPGRVLRTIDRGKFLLGQLTETEARLLMAAAAQHARHWRAVIAPASLILSVEFLTGGRTPAKVALLKVNSCGTPVVAKVAESCHIREEVRRFRTFIEAQDQQLRPSVHLHGNCGVIVFTLVPNDQTPMKPAPTLEQRLNLLRTVELYGEWSDARAPDSGDMIRAIRSATDKLLRLNLTPCSEEAFECFSNPSVAAFIDLEAQNITMGFSPDARRAREIAEKHFRRLANRATVHGDVHLRNILLVNDQLSHLIDYAYSGPGHPAVDLVRLELALYLGPYRQGGSHAESRALQTALSIKREPIASLRAQFPDFFRLKANSVCLEGCIIARDASLEAISKYGGDWTDYLAAKLLLAWHSLMLDGLNSGLAREVIDVITEQIMQWNEVA